MTRLWLVTYEIPKNQYKHILKKDVYSYTAFRTDKGLNDFIKRTGANFIKHNEVMTADHGKVQWFVAENIEIQEKLFWRMEEMKDRYNTFSDDKKPEWLTWDDILRYESLMCNVSEQKKEGK